MIHYFDILHQRLLYEMYDYLQCNSPDGIKYVTIMISMCTAAITALQK